MQVVLSIGTNTDHKNIEIAEERLYSLFSAVRVSRTIVSPAVDNPGEVPDYANVVILAETSLEYEELYSQVKTIEREMGRIRERENGAVVIDIDILKYDTRRYKPNDWKRPYNVILLSELETAQ